MALSVVFVANSLGAEKPNVVFIIADDLGYGEVGCFGQEKIPTPNIDKLAAGGMKLTQHYSGAPVCAPARCVLMSGKHLGHADIRGNRQAKVSFPQFSEGQHPIAKDTVLIPELFKNAGYATAAIGKWGLGPVGSTGDPNQHGFDLFFGYNCQAVAHSYYPKYLWRNDQQVEINAKPIPGHVKPITGEVKAEDYIGETYAPKLMISEAEKFIADKKGSPFFLYLAFIEPHVAMHPPLESVNKFPKEWDTEPHRGEAGYLPHPRPRAAYAAMISDLDSYVGRVVAALEKAGVADHTMIVFTGDNGTTMESGPKARFNVGGVDAKFFNSTAGLRGFKGSVYEGGLRVPTIVSYPGKVKAGSESNALGYFADWFPTLCAAAEIETPAKLDGENLLPVLEGGAVKKDRKPLVWVFPETSGQVAVRIGDYKVLKRGLNRKQSDPWEVYEIPVDRAETKNLAKEKPELIEEAVRILKQESAENPIFPVKIPEA
ncbi:arylsulfatase [Luteolibacter luteus]|uniref:arylsulfatase n=1 Tax=Luteolibacter luteus TaxID=2728835 RepID=UPI00197BFB11|nr:arylsulfatase [Luteolibacter luteus]